MLPDIIQTLQDGIKDTDTPLSETSLLSSFDPTPFGIFSSYPVAVVHDAKHIREKELLDLFDTHRLLHTEGLCIKQTMTRPDLSWDELQLIADMAPQYMQTVDYLVADTKELPAPQFEARRKFDRWKKLTEAPQAKAFIQHTLLNKMDRCETEHTLRNILRKYKENPLLKEIMFVWIAELQETDPEDVQEVVSHYFGENSLQIEKLESSIFIAWQTPLREIDMSSFVCPPN